MRASPTSRPSINTPYVAVVAAWIGVFGAPCNAPPWGHLTAVDLNTRQVVWKKVLGTAQDTGLFGSHLGVPIKTGVPIWAARSSPPPGWCSSERPPTSICGPMT